MISHKMFRKKFLALPVLFVFAACGGNHEGAKHPSSSEGKKKEDAGEKKPEVERKRADDYPGLW